MHTRSHACSDKVKKWLHGSFGVYTSKDWHWIFKIEWLSLWKARGFAFKFNFGYGDSGREICFHVCIPFLFAFYFVWARGFQCRGCDLGVAIHNGAIWLYTFSNTWNSNSKDPWYKKNHCWHFPWERLWYSTEVLEHKANLPGLAKVVWMEDRKIRRQKGGLNDWDARKLKEASVSEMYPYVYTRKNGDVQNRDATVFVTRSTYYARWWPIIPLKQVHTYIDIQFNDEVGEGTGSWKGGCVGCSWEMKPGETPRETLKRMESERKFDR